MVYCVCIKVKTSFHRRPDVTVSGEEVTIVSIVCKLTLAESVREAFATLSGAG